MAALVFVAACNSTPQGVDHRGDPGIPSARTDASSAYDPSTGTVVLFGGTTRTGVLDDTWTWDGTVWRKQRPSTSPPAREFAFMAYDAAISRLVLFGGTSCAPAAVTEPTGCEYQQVTTQGQDTWTWDGASWSQIKTQHAPAIAGFRGDFGGMVADSAHKDLLLVTWPTNSDASTVETWTFRDGDWQQLQPKHTPAQFEFSGPAYDAVSGHVILQQEAGRTNVTYWWDGSDWNLFDLSINTPHSPGQLVSVGSHGLLLIWSSSVYAWNGRSWSGAGQLASFVSAQDRPREGWTAAYHEPTNSLVLFGGRAGPGGPDLAGDTAAWDGTTWRTLIAAPSIPPTQLTQCDPQQAVGGMGSSPGTGDPSGAVVELEFAEPPSGPCHLHVDVVMTVFQGNDPVKMPGNPAVQTVDFELVPGGDRIAAVYDAHGVCALGPGVYARFG